MPFLLHCITFNMYIRFMLYSYMKQNDSKSKLRVHLQYRQNIKHHISTVMRLLMISIDYFKTFPYSKNPHVIFKNLN